MQHSRFYNLIHQISRVSFKLSILMEQYIIVMAHLLRTHKELVNVGGDNIVLNIVKCNLQKETLHYKFVTFRISTI